MYQPQRPSLLLWKAGDVWGWPCPIWYGKVDTSGQYGPTHVDTHLEGSLDHSQEQADQHATEQSRESLSRAVTRVEDRTREARTARTLTRVEETNAHGLRNGSADNPVVGIYRWVDKVQRVQVFRYPHRFLMEFQIPEIGGSSPAHNREVIAVELEALRDELRQFGFLDPEKPLFRIVVETAALTSGEAP
jgi:hypothetical protein